MAYPINFYQNDQKNHLVPNPYGLNQPEVADVNFNLIAAARVEPPRQLVHLQQENQVPTLWGINVMTHAKFVLLSLYGYIFAKTMMYIWRISSLIFQS